MSTTLIERLEQWRAKMPEVWYGNLLLVEAAEALRAGQAEIERLKQHGACCICGVLADGFPGWLVDSMYPGCQAEDVELSALSTEKKDNEP